MFIVHISWFHNKLHNPKLYSLYEIVSFFHETCPSLSLGIPYNFSLISSDPKAIIELE